LLAPGIEPKSIEEEDLRRFIQAAQDDGHLDLDGLVMGA
jgi:hypothetical protein